LYLAAEDFFFERKGTSVPNFIDREEAKSTTGSPGGGKKVGVDQSLIKRDAKHLAPAAIQRETSALPYLQQKAQGTLSARKYGYSSPSKSPS
jgi:hypothetical protein